MQQENDDMDELLRKAAENYPLKTDNADWERLRIALSAKGLSNAPIKNKNHRGLWLLLLLLPLSWAAYNYILFSGTSHKSIEPKGNSVKADKGSATIIKQNTIAESAAKANQPYLNQSASNSVAISYSFHKNKKSGNINSKMRTTVIPGALVSEEKMEEVAITKNEKINITGNKYSEENKTQESENDNDKQSDKILIKKDTTSDAIKNNNQIKKDGKNKKQKNKFLYAGIIIGPDISTIKFQSIKNAGINVGIILGYQLNKKVSIETGLIWDKKFYYTEGRYFNTGKINLPAYAKISNVNGYCEMIEIPLNLKYDFKFSGKANWFSVAGLSSYFMNKENYNYTIVSAGQPYPYNKNYKESSQFLFSALNISLGYAHSLGKVGTFRAEPYVKIPLKGVGIGSLPITSVGVNIGITKKIF